MKPRPSGWQAGVAGATLVLENGLEAERTSEWRTAKRDVRIVEGVP